jgi:hypothetical protein
MLKKEQSVEDSVYSIIKNKKTITKTKQAWLFLYLTYQLLIKLILLKTSLYVLNLIPSILLLNNIASIFAVGIFIYTEIRISKILFKENPEKLGLFFRNKDGGSRLTSCLSLRDSFTSVGWKDPEEISETKSVLVKTRNINKNNVDFSKFDRKYFKNRNSFNIKNGKDVMDNNIKKRDSTKKSFQDPDNNANKEILIEENVKNKENNLMSQIIVQDKFKNLYLIQRKCGYVLMIGSVLNISYLIIFFFILSLSFTLNSFAHQSHIVRSSSFSLGISTIS